MSGRNRISLALLVLLVGCALYPLVQRAVQAERPGDQKPPVPKVETKTATDSASPIAASPVQPVNSLLPELLTPLDRYEASLDKKVSFDFKNASSEQVALAISKVVGLPVEIDDSIMPDNGNELEKKRITFSVQDVTLRNALHLFFGLRKFDVVVKRGNVLRYQVWDSEAVPQLKLGVYYVRDLVTLTDEWDEESYDVDSLTQPITTIIQPKSWDSVGGPGSIKYYNGSLGIHQTDQALVAIQHLLARLREVRNQQLKSPGGQSQYLGISRAEEEAHERIRAILARPWDIEIQEQPLDVVLKQIGAHYQVQFHFDESSLKEARIKKDTQVSLNAKGISLEVALQRLLEPLTLNAQYGYEVLVVHADGEDARLETRIYPVADLVKFDENSRPDADSPEAFTQTMKSVISPTSWGTGGNKGMRIVISHDSAKVLVVSQTQDVHREIEAYLARLRELQRQHPQPVRPPQPRPKDDEIVMRVFTLYGPTNQHVPAAAIVDVIKEKLGPKVWQEKGVFIKAVEIESVEDGKSAPGVPSIVVQHKFSVIRDVRKILLDLNLGPGFQVKPPRPFVIS